MFVACATTRQSLAVKESGTRQSRSNYLWLDTTYASSKRYSARKIYSLGEVVLVSGRKRVAARSSDDP